MAPVAETGLRRRTGIWAAVSSAAVETRQRRPGARIVVPAEQRYRGGSVAPAQPDLESLDLRSLFLTVGPLLGRGMSEAIELPSTLAWGPGAPDDGPLVSLAVASYEARRDRISRLLESIADQPYANVEVVIADSSRLSYLEATAERTDWIRYVPCDPEGVSAGFNEAIEHADGEIVGIIADDDYATEARIVRAVEVIKDGADVVYGDVYDLDEATGEINYRSAMPIDDPDTQWIELFRFDGRRGSIPAATVTFRADCVEDERFDERLDGGEDYHLWVRLFEHYDPAHVPEPMAVMRQHDDSLSSDPDMMYENRLQAIDLLCDRYPELRQYRAERELLERYDYGRHLLGDDRTAEARSIFAELLREERYYRAAIMFCIALLPFGQNRAIQTLDRIHDRVA